MSSLIGSVDVARAISPTAPLPMPPQSEDVNVIVVVESSYCESATSSPVESVASAVITTTTT